ncbi:MAG: TonB-dependent receptor, partial [Gammaproteobacteria bacterium]|nr:TonB-dependent receptor [Gammaproteobacteria bacterium]
MSKDTQGRGGVSMARRGVLLLCLMSLTVLAQPDYTDEEALAALYGDAELVSIATGNMQPLNRAPAVATVITEQEIERMGARDLDEVLEAVPGLHVSRRAAGYNPVYSIRGIHTETNPQVLVLVNGIPITQIQFGDRGQAWTGMSVRSIRRIEVIRGPGSALYGADAFSGTINIITKGAGDIEQTEIGAALGSFDTREAWLITGGRVGGAEVAFSMEYLDTDGQDEIIGADAQSALDLGFGTSASLAPGGVNLARETLNARLDVALGNWDFQVGYRGGLDHGGLGAGAAQALDPAGEGDAWVADARLGYERRDFLPDWDLDSQLSYQTSETKLDLLLFPPGAVFLGGPFPNGVQAQPEISEQVYRWESGLTFRGFDAHRIQFGVGFIYAEISDADDRKNFVGVPPFAAPLLNTLPFIVEEDRETTFLLVQDEWQFAPDWALTAGLRWDHYSDFGDTVNPRLALVWQTRYDLTTKLLYGRAFRAPSFAESFNINNPVALGNPDLDAETIDTYELAFDWRPREAVQSRLNVYYYEMADILRFVQDPLPATSATAQNTGEQTGYGLEWEVVWELARDLQLHANYAYQKSTDEAVDDDVGFAPTHQIYGRADWQFRENWNFDTQLNWVADRKRSNADPRSSEVDDFITVDLTLRGDDLIDDWGLSLSVRNLFDEDVREPSNETGLIP